MRKPRLSAGLAVAASVAMAMIVPVPSASAADPWTVVASGLNSPRHLTFASGELYVVEAGEGGDGPCSVHPLGVFCLGLTGAVTRVSDSGPDQRVVTGLPSIIGGGETLGPSDIEFTGRNYVLSIGLGGSVEFRDAFGDAGDLLGTLVSGKLGRPGVTLFADVLDIENVQNPDGTDVDSNPVGILRQGGSYEIADAGGNALVRVSHQGNFTDATAFPPVSTTPQPFPPADAVPTSVVEGPDHAFYVSQLTGFPFEQGAASIFRVVPGQDPVVWASGLTNVTDLAFSKDGSLYAVQISDDGLLTGVIGSLIKVNPNSSTHQTVAGGLFAPYGVAIVKNSAYVSVCTVCVGGGEVIKIPLAG